MAEQIPTTLLELVEKFGFTAVAVFLIWNLSQKIDKKLDDLIASIKELIEIVKSGNTEGAKSD